MYKRSFFFLLILFPLFGASQSVEEPPPLEAVRDVVRRPVRGALVTTRFQSLDELKQVVQIEYFRAIPNEDSVLYKNPMVRLIHVNSGREVRSFLRPGIRETDIARARDGGLWAKASLAMKSPYFVVHRKDILRIYLLGRRKYRIFGESDAAFFDLSEAIQRNISKEDLSSIHPDDLSEKGYFNSFNHITAQAFMTTIFSEELADFIADMHERTKLPELITGVFSQKQIDDINNGPVDNYIDMINNEWGQELGKQLKEKYNIHRTTEWTPQLLANYLNDLQAYYSWAFQIAFRPFRPSDEIIQRFSKKINRVMGDVSGLEHK